MPPGFERLILEFDEPAVKSLLVDLDEQGRAKGGRIAEPPELLNDLLKSLQRKEWKTAAAEHIWRAAANDDWTTSRSWNC